MQHVRWKIGGEGKAESPQAQPVRCLPQFTPISQSLGALEVGSKGSARLVNGILPDEFSECLSLLECLNPPFPHSQSP